MSNDGITLTSMKHPSLVDSECLKLARHFLDDHAPFLENDAKALAETIQEAVEDWLRERFDS